MLPELLQTIPVHVLQHTRRAPRHLPALGQALGLALAVGLGLAEHEVVIVRFAAGADEEAGGEERGGGGADLGDLGDAVGEGCGVDENLLVEAGEGN
ncbi:hypothetical protein Tdes44962_MAKER00244 [Teratosphaeria destructans]|uniref:Uncharacterized protein n=1 Tax=Teratosphaeria destructans TaxID=418781 RepID=A0A9W7SVL0_9PEZI|nr:hypothetical protein Tdes44962_MAKER00244 [Teratosphaeria destructans]